MPSSKKMDLKRDFAAGVLSVWGSLSSYEPKPHLHIVYVYTVYFFTQGREEGGELTRKKLRWQKFTKPVENTNMTDCISSLVKTSKDDI